MTIWARTVLHRGSTPSFSDGLRNARFYWVFRVALASGGEGGIRTPDRLAPMPHFECGAFDHSATSPGTKTAVSRRVAGRVLCEDAGPDKAPAAFSCHFEGMDWARQKRQGHDSLPGRGTKPRTRACPRRKLRASPFLLLFRIAHGEARVAEPGADGEDTPALVVLHEGNLA